VPFTISIRQLLNVKEDGQIMRTLVDCVVGGDTVDTVPARLASGSTTRRRCM